MQQLKANEHVYQLATGHWAPRCLQLIAEVGVADHLGDEPRPVDELAEAANVNADALARILRLLSMHDVFSLREGYCEHTTASRVLRSDHPQSMRAMVRLHGFCWQSFSMLERSLRTGTIAEADARPEGIFAYLAEHPDQSAIFDSAMTAKAHADMAAIIPVYDFSAFSVIADIGGGRGHILRAVLNAAPYSKGILFDLPSVLGGVAPDPSGRIALHPGDFFKDELPRADVYILSTVIHDWADTEALELLWAVRRAAPATAKVLLFETIVPEGPEPHPAKGLDIHMLATTGGRERTRNEYERLLSEAGLKVARVIPANRMSVIEATPT